ncbi:hypothetical protein Tco_0386166 [Tanacetum coccineum]
MSNFLKNQGTWKLNRLKKLNFEEVKAEFENLVKQLDTYVPMKFEATKESLKRFGEELQTKTAKKLKFDDEGTIIPINSVPVAIKSPSIANYKIIKQGRKAVYQIVRENGTDMVYISFGAMLTDISRDDLTKLYRIFMKKHGMNETEDEFEKSTLFELEVEMVFIDHGHAPFWWRKGLTTPSKWPKLVKRLPEMPFKVAMIPPLIGVNIPEVMRISLETII